MKALRRMGFGPLAAIMVLAVPALLTLVPAAANGNWPGAAGPNGSWTARGRAFPIHWSVTRSQSAGYPSRRRARPPGEACAPLDMMLFALMGCAGASAISIQS